MEESQQVINLIGLRPSTAVPKLIDERSDLEHSIAMRSAYMQLGGAPPIGEINEEIRDLGRKNNWSEEQLALIMADPKVQSRVGLDISSQRLKRLSNRLYGDDGLNEYRTLKEVQQRHKSRIRLDTGASFEGEKAYKNNMLM
jgi:hypothetical protein